MECTFFAEDIRRARAINAASIDAIESSDESDRLFEAAGGSNVSDFLNWLYEDFHGLADCGKDGTIDWMTSELSLADLAVEYAIEEAVAVVDGWDVEVP